MSAKGVYDPEFSGDEDAPQELRLLRNQRANIELRRKTAARKKAAYQEEIERLRREIREAGEEPLA